MFALAHALADTGHSVLTTTTTKIFEPEPSESDCVVFEPDAVRLVERLQEAFALRRHVTAAARLAADGRKLEGLDVAALDAVVDSRVADHLLVEADGAAGRSLKAHTPHEPVVSARADLVIAVIGADCLGTPMDDEHVHRAGILRARLGRPEGALVTPEDVAGIVLHPDGYLARVRPITRVFVFINKAGTAQAHEQARQIGERLRQHDRAGRISRLIIGDVRERVFQVVRSTP
jgi:probable selenium-dependent hydroxylase accessory protein YqeC